jgi:ATP-dependent exoDNAse (exonuclease V) alpha subunit
MPPEWSNNISTIHKLLDFQPEISEVEVKSKISGRPLIETQMRFIPGFDESHVLDKQFIILDEASMVPVTLWNTLLKACPPHIKFLLIGDIHQLPPVSSQSVLGFAMAEWPVFELTQIHRQARDNPIIANAHRILRGKFPRNEPHFFIIGTRTGAVAKNGKPIKLPANSLALQRDFLSRMCYMRDKGVYVPLRDAIIVPKKTSNSLVSSTSLNVHLPALMNPPRRLAGSNTILNPRIPIHTGKRIIRLAVGDKILVIENMNDRPVPITNGMTGVVEKISVNSAYDMTRGGNAFGKDALLGQPEGDDFGESEDDFDSELESLSENSEDSFAATIGEDESGEVNSDTDPQEQHQASHIVTVRFDGIDEPLELSTSGEYSQITFGYAVTCHKMQGGECPNIFILAHSCDIIGNLMSREWLYTAVTRARGNVFLFTDDKMLARMLTTCKIVGETLQEKIASFRELASSKVGRADLPVLPPNCLTD